MVLCSVRHDLGPSEQTGWVWMPHGLDMARGQFQSFCHRVKQNSTYNTKSPQNGSYKEEVGAGGAIGKGVLLQSVSLSLEILNRVFQGKSHAMFNVHIMPNILPTGGYFRCPEES